MSTSLHPTISLLQSNSLASVVQQAIEQSILAGDYAPGTKLLEATLADKLGVSRGPVREAFRMLDEAGLVRTEKNRGVFVRDMSEDEAAEIFDLRAAMEEMVGRHLATHITPVQMQRLEAFVTDMQQAVDASNADAYHQLNLAFHDRLVELTGNRRLMAIYRKLIKELSLFRRRNLADSGALPLSVRGHRHIVEAIASGHAEQAGRAMAEHVQGSKQRMLGHTAAQATAGHTAATSAGQTDTLFKQGL